MNAAKRKTIKKAHRIKKIFYHSIKTTLRLRFLLKIARFSVCRSVQTDQKHWFLVQFRMLKSPIKLSSIASRIQCNRAAYCYIYLDVASVMSKPPRLPGKVSRSMLTDTNHPVFAERHTTCCVAVSKEVKPDTGCTIHS